MLVPGRAPPEADSLLTADAAWRVTAAALQRIDAQLAIRGLNVNREGDAALMACEEPIPTSATSVLSTQGRFERVLAEP